MVCPDEGMRSFSTHNPLITRWGRSLIKSNSPPLYPLRKINQCHSQNWSMEMIILNLGR